VTDRLRVQIRSGLPRHFELDQTAVSERAKSSRYLTRLTSEVPRDIARGVVDPDRNVAQDPPVESVHLVSFHPASAAATRSVVLAELRCPIAVATL
jgi:hypothetical protein